MTPQEKNSLIERLIEKHTTYHEHSETTIDTEAAMSELIYLLEPKPQKEVNNYNVSDFIKLAHELEGYSLEYSKCESDHLKGKSTAYQYASKKIKELLKWHGSI